MGLPRLVSQRSIQTHTEWERYHAIVTAFKVLEYNETLVVQSGMPVAIFKTHRLAPRVVMANPTIMKATWEVFYDLQDKNLTMFAQYRAAPGDVISGWPYLNVLLICGWKPA